MSTETTSTEIFVTEGCIDGCTPDDIHPFCEVAHFIWGDPADHPQYVPEPREEVQAIRVPEEPVIVSTDVSDAKTNSIPDRSGIPEVSGFDEINAEIDARWKPVERVIPFDVDQLEASWTTPEAKRARRLHGKGRDFINQWVRALGQDPELSRRNSTKFAAAVLASYADETTGTVALGMAEWAEAVGTAKTNIVAIRKELIELRWISPGPKVGQRTVFDLSIPGFQG